MDNLHLFTPALPAPAERHVFGTITGLDPLRVLLDGDASPLPATPTTITSVQAGDRVLVLVKGLQRVIVGRIGGQAGLSASPAFGHTPSTLVRTDIPASASAMLLATVWVHGYTTTNPGLALLQTYRHQGAFLSSVGMTTVPGMTGIWFTHEGVIWLWLPSLGYSTSLIVTIHAPNLGRADRTTHITPGVIPPGAPQSVVTFRLLADSDPRQYGAATSSQTVAGGASGVIATSSITIPTRKLVNVAGNHVATTEGNAGGSLRVTIAGASSINSIVARVHSHGLAMRTAPGWSRSWPLGPGTHNITITAETDLGSASPIAWSESIVQISHP